MATHGDLQELLRMFTARKVSMMGAMGHIKALQARNLKTISDIAETPLPTLEEVIGDAKLAKSLHTACKGHGKQTKRKAAETEDGTSPTSKKARLEPHKRDVDYNSMSPDDLEESMSLPLVEDEASIRETKIETNRAPLVLAFAVEVLRFTMPEQPPSSRLSLAQAVVAANSRTKALSIGIEKGTEEQLPEGQPKVQVLGRQIPVLKRGDYTWSGNGPPASQASTATMVSEKAAPKTWVASAVLKAKDSTFIAHAARLESPAARPALMKQLMMEKPELEGASHNAWAMRKAYGNSPLVQEASFDDGESGCGKLMLEVMRQSDVADSVVVLTRWFGGQLLYNDRWRLMREATSGAISAQQQTFSSLSGEALWGLNTQDQAPSTTTIGMAIHRPEAARNYLLKSFASAHEGEEEQDSKKTLKARDEEKQENLGRLLGAIRLLCESWAGFLGPKDLDRRAWGWYVAVRPDIESGPAGWGGKGTVDLSRILNLRRKPPKVEVKAEEETGTEGRADDGGVSAARMAESN